jgi:hypothetical protein
MRFNSIGKEQLNTKDTKGTKCGSMDLRFEMSDWGLMDKDAREGGSAS